MKTPTKTCGIHAGCVGLGTTTPCDDPECWYFGRMNIKTPKNIQSQGVDAERVKGSDNTRQRRQFINPDTSKSDDEILKEVLQDVIIQPNKNIYLPKILQKAIALTREACEKESQEQIVDIDFNHDGKGKVGKALHDSVTRETYN